MPAPLRVLMTTDTLGGVWTYALDLVRALGDRARVTLATMGAPVSDAQRAAAAGAGAQLCESSFRLEWMDNSMHEVAAAGDWLLGLEKTLRPDIVHLNNYCHGALPWRAPVLVVGHSCVCSWWEAVHGRSAPPEWDPYREAVAAGLKAASLVVAPTAAMLRTLDRLYGPLPETRVIYNGLDPARFGPSQKENIVLSVGRLWDHAKNIPRLAGIAHRITWPVYVAGDCRSPDDRELPMQNVCPLGRLDRADIAQWMGRAAIYALPARYEPFGLSVLEAAASGCALVVGNIPSLREIWDDAAAYVAPEDEQALCATIERLIRNEDERNDLATRGRMRAIRFSIQRTADAYWGAYSELLGCDVKMCPILCNPAR